MHICIIYIYYIYNIQGISNGNRVKNSLSRHRMGVGRSERVHSIHQILPLIVTTYHDDGGKLSHERRLSVSVCSHVQNAIKAETASIYNVLLPRVDLNFLDRLALCYTNKMNIIIYAR